MEPVATHQGRVGPFPITPAQVLVLWFAGAAAVGTVGLLLPVASAPDRHLRVIDAFFMAVSAVCVTGLAVKDLATDLSLVGQLIILGLVQLGGLGYMVSSTVIIVLLGKKVGIKQRLVMQEALNVLSVEGVIHLLRGILWITVVVEGLGAAILSIRFSFDFPWPRAIYLGVFHAVSAFNNAGFSPFSTNLIAYQGDLTVNLVITTLIIIGGIGFIVYRDLRRFFSRLTFRLTVHTWMVLTMTAGLIVSGTALFWALETSNPSTLGGLRLTDQLMVSYFHAVSARTAGFNTIDLSTSTGAALYLLILLMFIGASPGGTGGGIKTSTFGTMLIGLWAGIRGRADVTAFHRRMPQETVIRAFSVALLAFFLTTGMTLILQASEGRDFLRTLFEVTSAFGTVGLSTGDGGVLSYTALFSDFGKLMIILTMFIGRIGPLTVGVALVRVEETRRFRYPPERVLIG
ncbi:MAG: Trk family potassium uptake protein [Nitrospirae bacterium]|nr:Trk family potassium uptake protein [Nitrospirota bacterium]